MWSMVLSSARIFSKGAVFASAAMLQPVVDGLVKASMIGQAKELVKLGNTNSYKRFNLKLPSDE